MGSLPLAGLDNTAELGPGWLGRADGRGHRCNGADSSAFSLVGPWRERVAEGRPDGLTSALSRPHVHNEAAATEQQQASHTENGGRQWWDSVVRAVSRD